MLGWDTVMDILNEDFFGYSADSSTRSRETDFESYSIISDDSTHAIVTTTEARVAGTEFSIVLLLIGVDESNNVNNANSALRGSIGFVFSGNGDTHGPMEEGEFYAFYPFPFDNEITWRQLPSHPGASRWAPGSFVIRGTARAYITSGYDRTTGLLHSDVWMIDLSSLLTEQQQQESDTDIIASNINDGLISGSADVQDEQADELDLEAFANFWSYLIALFSNNP
mmetsp:Transcript_36745/g.44324  ORF Transcript_36745/g.44324 Transcript_36745/m.44324 type:complete len:225 (-) Transcript_36745:156-830(-)